jgi:hypothetical protein
MRAASRLSSLHGQLSAPITRLSALQMQKSITYWYMISLRDKQACVTKISAFKNQKHHKNTENR